MSGDERAPTALALLWEVSLLLGEDMEAGLLARGLTRARAELLGALEHHGPLTQRGLAEVLGVSPRNVTGLVDALQRGGYLDRGPHPTDRRALRVTLTARGHAAVSATLGDAQRLAGHLFADLDAADLDRLIALLGSVRERCRELPPPPTRARSANCPSP